MKLLLFLAERRQNCIPAHTHTHTDGAIGLHQRLFSRRQQIDSSPRRPSGCSAEPITDLTDSIQLLFSFSYSARGRLATDRGGGERQRELKREKETEIFLRALQECLCVISASFFKLSRILCCFAVSRLHLLRTLRCCNNQDAKKRHCKMNVRTFAKPITSCLILTGGSCSLCTRVCLNWLLLLHRCR